MILVLCFVPCADTDLDKGKDEIEISTTHGTSDNHTADFCSPFCQCSCCTSPIVTLFNNYILKAPVIVITSCFEHLPGRLLDSPFSVWQPPRLS